MQLSQASVNTAPCGNVCIDSMPVLPHNRQKLQMVSGNDTWKLFVLLYRVWSLRPRASR